MKKILSAILILISVSFIFAQETQPKPLTQAEYVKILYELERSFGKKDEVIEAIRKRGIAFQLTDGLRSLTRSKGKNDTELQRTLEEAERRRQNPSAAKLPSGKEAREIIEKTRANTLTAVEEMPDFTVKQLVSRGAAYAGTNNWQSIDKLTVAVNYSTTKGEQYKVLAVNGTLVNAEAGSNYNGMNGATTSGEFVAALAQIFKPESKTEIDLIDTDTLRGRKTLVYQYKIALDNIKEAIEFKAFISDTARFGKKGKIWIDRETNRVLRIEYQATDLPANFGVKGFATSIDYDWIEIAGEKYLLPILSDARFKGLSKTDLIETRNLIRFKNYQKYGSEVKILDDDEVLPEEKPN